MLADTLKPVVLLVDSGNTRVKIGWITPDKQREPEPLAFAHGSENAIHVWLAQHRLRPTQAMGVNVAGAEKAHSLHYYMKQTYGVILEWLDAPPSAGGVVNGYRHPKQLGADRWWAMVGLAQARGDHITPRLLANIGTATTIDTLCPTNILPKAGAPLGSYPWTYVGGLIVPGPTIMLTALADNTAQLPQARGAISAFPTETHDAISSGVAAAQAGAVIRQWWACLDKYGTAPQVYATGGAWPMVAKEVERGVARVRNAYSLPPARVVVLSAPVLDGLAAVVS